MARLPKAKLPAARRDEASIHVRLESDLKDQFEAAAQQWGHKPSTWLRWIGELVVRGEMTPPKTPTHRAA
jgi:hypothetical protein